MEIPVQNIYYLLCYAWDRLDEGRLLDVRTEDLNQIHDLLARVLGNGVRHLLRKGLDRGYVARSEVRSRITGKVGFSESIRRMLLPNAQAYCSFDEFSHNILHNRIIKATVRSLFHIDGLDSDLKDDLAGLLVRLHEIDDVPLRGALFRGVQRHRNIQFYDFLLRVCELVCHNTLVAEETGRASFQDFLRDPRQMASLFEDFVRNFYRVEMPQFDVRREQAEWQVVPDDPEAAKYLPKMLTDVSLISSERRIIIECKYYTETLQSHYGVETIHSGHLYQLLAYLSNLAEKYPGCEMQGVLLYPTVSRSLDLRYCFHGIPVRVCTVNLNDDWRVIHERLLAIIDSDSAVIL
jgi:5-methylcytosine-specific restriction enzyme subunit McrC